MTFATRLRCQSEPKIMAQRAYLSSQASSLQFATLRQAQLEPGQHEAIIRYQRTPNILLKPSPSRPITTGKSKRTLQPGDIRLNPRPKISQLLINPMALHHLQHRKTLLLGKGHILDPHAFGLLKILLRGKTPIRAHLPRRPTINSFLPLHQYGKKDRVIGIPPLHHTIQNHSRFSTRQKHLMPKLHLARPLDNNIRMTLKKRHQLLIRRNLLPMEDPTLRLRNDPLGPNTPPLQPDDAAGLLVPPTIAWAREWPPDLPQNSTQAPQFVTLTSDRSRRVKF